MILCFNIMFCFVAKLLYVLSVLAMKFKINKNIKTENNKIYCITNSL